MDKCDICDDTGIIILDCKVEACRTCNRFESDDNAAEAAVKLLLALHEIIETVEATGGCAVDKWGMHNPLATIGPMDDVSAGWSDLGEPVVAAMQAVKLKPTIHIHEYPEGN